MSPACQKRAHVRILAGSGATSVRRRRNGIWPARVARGAAQERGQMHLSKRQIPGEGHLACVTQLGVTPHPLWT